MNNNLINSQKTFNNQLIHIIEIKKVKEFMADIIFLLNLLIY